MIRSTVLGMLMAMATLGVTSTASAHEDRDFRQDQSEWRRHERAEERFRETAAFRREGMHRRPFFRVYVPPMYRPAPIMFRHHGPFHHCR